MHQPLPAAAPPAAALVLTLVLTAATGPAHARSVSERSVSERSVSERSPSERSVLERSTPVHSAPVRSVHARPEHAPPVRPRPAQPRPGHPQDPAGAGECTFPMRRQIAGRPWALQRLTFDALWARTRGKGVRVAVIDSGVDGSNPQLTGALDTGAGRDFLDPGSDGTHDTVGHGTKVAGVIAARPRPGTGFVGLAPEATVIPIRQNDGRRGADPAVLARAIDHAVDRGARVINISQDTTAPLTADSPLAVALRRALREAVVVASAGNDGLSGRARRTYPAAFPGVLAVAASDRNNERAAFSQPGDFIGVAAPGVDMVSTVPGFGQCLDNGTSFSAPYVAGVAALLRAAHPQWTVQEVVWQIENTAERSVNGRDDYVGWGVVDPVRALTEDRGRPGPPVPDTGPPPAAAPEAVPLRPSGAARERDERIATYALAVTGLLVAVIAVTAAVVREARGRRRRPR